MHRRNGFAKIHILKEREEKQSNLPGYSEMKNKQLRKKGVHVSSGQSALEALRTSVPHWIHHTVKDEHYIGGVKYLPECECSECGYVSRTEHNVCPHCGAKMHQLDQ